jgi:hypothetical protein
MYDYQKQRRRMQNADTIFDVVIGVGCAIAAVMLLRWWFE